MSYRNKKGRRRRRGQKLYHYFLDGFVFIISKLLFLEKKADPALPPTVATDHFCEAGTDSDGWETICSVCKKRKAKAERMESLQGLIDEKRIYLK